jgi:hypothetical protein
MFISHHSGGNVECRRLNKRFGTIFIGQQRLNFTAQFFVACANFNKEV